jgi:hypothetical protein
MPEHPGPRIDLFGEPRGQTNQDPCDGATAVTDMPRAFAEAKIVEMPDVPEVVPGTGILDLARPSSEGYGSRP